MSLILSPSPSLWKKEITVESLNAQGRNTIHDSLGIVFTEIGPHFLEAEMPVDARTHQVAGLLHGGASAVLAESLGSVASLCLNRPTSPITSVLGVELHVSHLQSASSGKVVGHVQPVKVGRTLHRWQIDIYSLESVAHPQPGASSSKKGKHISSSQLTVLVSAETREPVRSI